jgi:hypothetical protein
MMEAATTTETSANFYQTTRHNNPEKISSNYRAVSEKWKNTALSPLPSNSLVMLVVNSTPYRLIY